MGKKEHRRALDYYRQALQLSRLAPKGAGRAGAAGSTPGKAGAAGVTSSDGKIGGEPSGVGGSGINEAEVKFKMGQCHLALKEMRAWTARMQAWHAGGGDEHSRPQAVAFGAAVQGAILAGEGRRRGGGKRARVGGEAADGEAAGGEAAGGGTAAVGE